MRKKMDRGKDRRVFRRTAIRSKKSTLTLRFIEEDTGELFPCIPKSIISGIAAKKGITEGVENV